MNFRHLRFNRHSLQGLSRHLEVIIPLGFWKTLKVHQTWVQLLIIIPELRERERVREREFTFNKDLEFIYMFVFELVQSTHHSIGPTLFNTSHSPELMDVFCKLLSDSLQMRR